MDKATNLMTHPTDDSIPAVVVFDLDLRVKMCNPAFEELLLHSASEFLGKHLVNGEPPDDLVRAAVDLARRVLEGDNVFEEATHMRRRDGSSVHVQLSGFPLSIEGQPLGVFGVLQDVTRRREDDLKLRMLVKALETTQLGVTVTDTNGTILFANRADAHMHGYEVRDLLDKDVRIFAPRELWNPMSSEQLRRLSSRRRETVNARKDGSTFPVQLLSDLVTDANGEPIAVVTTCEDITQRKEVERQLKILGKVFETTKLGVTVADPDGKILYANPAEADLHGCEVRDLINQDVRIFAPEELWNPMSKDQLRRIHSQPRKTLNVRQDGTVFPVQLTSDVVNDQEGEPIAVVTTCEDISLTMAIEQVAEAIVVTDPEGTIRYVNPAFASITGYSAEDAVGRNWRLIASAGSAAAFFDEIWQSLLAGSVWQGRFTAGKEDGGTFEADATIAPVKDPYGRVISFVFVSRDITEEVALEEQRRESQKMEAIGRLAGGIAHDFNNLLVAIQGHALFAQQDLPPGAAGHEDLMEVQRAAEKAAALTGQLLAFGRRQVLDRTGLDLNRVISDLMKLLERVISEDIEIVLVPGRSLGTIYADSIQIEQVILNLCVNARDAMPQGGTITLRTENSRFDRDFSARHPWAREGRFVRLTVSDTGCGMGDETMGHIFEPFFTTKEVGEGTGLGLATLHGIVEQHGGLTHVTSQQGAGTSFEVYFPVDGRTVSDEPKPAPAPEPARGGRETILVAEDDHVVRRIVVRTLEKGGYTVLTTQNGLEAIQVFEDNDAIDLILLDIVMPVMGGVAARQRILESAPDALVMFSTGYSAEAAQMQYSISDKVPMVAKPYRPDDLLRRVRGVLDASRSSRAVLT